MARIILVILIVGISNLLYGQDHRLQTDQLLDSAKLLWYVDFNKTEQLLSKAEKLISTSGQAVDLIEVYELHAVSCQAFSRFQLWRQYLGKIDSLLTVRQSELGEQYNLRRLKSQLFRAQYYFAINDDARALELFNRLLSDYKKLPQSAEVCNQLYTLCNEISGIHSRRGEYEASINLHLASIPYFECVDKARGKQSSRALIYRNIGRSYLEKRDYNQAGKYLRLAELSIQGYLKDAPLKASRIALSLYETQASYFVQVNKNDSALLAMQKAVPLLKLPNINIDDEFKGRINQSLGNLYLLENKLKDAERHFDLAEAFFLKFQSRQSYFLSDLYLKKALLYERNGDAKLALGYCEKGIDQLIVNFKPDADGNPFLKNVISKKQLFSILQKKSQLEEKLYNGKDVSILLRAFNTNQLSLALLDSTANEFSLDKDKIILSEQSYSAFEDGIRISNSLYQKTRDEKYFTNVISLIEKSKGNLLLENLRLVNRFSGIKQEWLEREKELKSEMLLVEQSLYQTEKSDHQKSRERYAVLKRDYSSLIEQIKREAPDYYKLRFDHSVASPQTIQQQLLKPGEALIEFFVGDSILAVAGFTKGKKYLNLKPILPDFAEELNEFRTVLTTGNSDFLDRSKAFYDFLLEDCLASLGPEIKALIIIPDGMLGYLPFEVLVQSRNPKVLFLNETFAIHYAHSATYLMEQMQRKPSGSKNFFAGFVSSGSGQASSNQVAARDQKLAVLQGAEHEVASITELFNSNFTVFNPANKLDFMNKASNYKILHFAMHSSLNDENPMMSVMVFSEVDTTEHLLTAIELYSMKLNSDLAVLSACNTGVGQLHRGEGIMSFSRAFAYAGVPSAVISLWKVPDIATSKIMVNFYSHLKNGESKDKALQLARQDFIRENPEMAHPYYWSGFILTGNNSPLSFPQSNFLWWIIISLLVLAGLFATRKKITKLLRRS